MLLLLLVIAVVLVIVVVVIVAVVDVNDQPLPTTFNQDYTSPSMITTI